MYMGEKYYTHALYHHAKHRDVADVAGKFDIIDGIASHGIQDIDVTSCERFHASLTHMHMPLSPLQ